MNKKVIVSLAAIVISASIGLPIAITSIGITAENTSPKLMGATLEISSSSTVFSAVSSTPSSTPVVSSTVSSAVSQIVSSAVVSSSPPPVYTPIDNTAAKNTAIQVENDRHTNYLNNLNAIYDPQIKVSQDLIQGYKDSGAKNVTVEMAALQKTMDNIQTYLNNGPPATHALDPITIENNTRWYNEDATIYAAMQLQKTAYDKMVIEQNKVASLQTQKEPWVKSENDNHDSRLQQINLIFA